MITYDLKGLFVQKHLCVPVKFLEILAFCVVKMSTKYFLKLAQLVCALMVDLVMTINKYYVGAVAHVGSVWLFVLLVFLQDHLCVWL